MAKETNDDGLAFWTREVWRHPTMAAPNRFLLLALAYLANSAGSVTMTQGTLATFMNVHIRTVVNATKRCERHGWIEIQPGPSRRRGAREGLTYRLVTERERKSG